MSQTAFVSFSTGELPVNYRRRRTRVVQVGKVKIGGENPVVVQSMITAETMNTPAAVEQIIQLHEAGAEIVRVTTPNLREAQNVGEIKAELKRRGYGHIPLVADVHHQGMEIAIEAAKHVEKVRINPGLFVFRKPDPTRMEYAESEIQQELEAIESTLLPVLKACQARGIAMRIGVNHGSLSERIKVMYGDSPMGMVESALEYVRICERHGFRDIVLSLKASRVQVMLAAYRLMANQMAKEKMDYPLHLGVTEAGDGVYARVKSSIGIGTLLAEGIGDTIRVSLAEDPVNEIEVCYDILQALGLRKTKVEYIACPSCGRTKFDLPTVLNEVRDATKHLVGLDIAVMGCFPPGEKVITRRGFEAIETLQEGQPVLTHTGDFSSLTALHAHDFEGDLIEIKPCGAPAVRMTPHHPVWTISKSGCKDGRRVSPPLSSLCLQEPRWYPAEAIDRDSVVLYPVIQGEVAIERIPEMQGCAFDKDYLNLAMDSVASNQRLPAWMLTLPKHLQTGLLRALWQWGGATRTVRGYPCATYVTVSPTLSFQVHQLLLRQGIIATLGERRLANRQTVYSVSVTSAAALRRFSEVLRIPVAIPDERPRTARLALDERYLYLPVLSVQRIPYRGPVYNLEVAEVHTYVSSLCIVHNCIVNGPGEMADADYGYVGRGPGKIALYRKHELVKNDIPAERGVEELIALLKADGVWQDPEH